MCEKSDMKVSILYFKLEKRESLMEYWIDISLRYEWYLIIICTSSKITKCTPYISFRIKDIIYIHILLDQFQII